jgi:hypothetical protein
MTSSASRSAHLHPVTKSLQQSTLDCLLHLLER